MNMPIWSALERMAMFDIYYHNRDEGHWPRVKFDDYQNSFYKDLTARTVYSRDFWNNKLTGENNHAV